MNRMTLRILSGAACAAGFLAFGMGVAQADDSSPDQGLLGAKVDVNLGSGSKTSEPTTSKPLVKVDLKAKVAYVAKVMAKVAAAPTHRAKPVVQAKAKVTTQKASPAKAIPAKARPATPPTRADPH